MKDLLGVMVLSSMILGSMATGCSAYSGAAGLGDKVVIASNNGLLFGLFRKVYVCKVTDKGLANCSHDESP